MTQISRFLPDEAAAAAFGRALAQALRAGDIVLLEGDLGAGKTTLARGLIAAFCQTNEAPSPTFTLVETYDGQNPPLWHFDLYRLEKAEDVWELGLEDALDNSVCLIEWPDRISGLLPAGALRLRLKIEEDGRTLACDADENWRRRLEAAGVL